MQRTMSLLWRRTRCRSGCSSGALTKQMEARLHSVPAEAGIASAVAVSQVHILSLPGPLLHREEMRPSDLLVQRSSQLRRGSSYVLQFYITPIKSSSICTEKEGRSVLGLPSMCKAQGSSCAEQAASPGRPRAQEKPKSAHRSSQPLRTEWSIAAVTPSGPVSKTPRESGAQQVPAPALAPLEATEVASANSEPAAHGAQHDGGASLAPHDRDGELAGPSPQPEGHSSHAASTAQRSSNPHSDSLRLSDVQHSSRQQRQHGVDSCGREDAQPYRDALEPQLPGSSPPQSQPPKVVSSHLQASLPLAAGSSCRQQTPQDLGGSSLRATQRMQGWMAAFHQADMLLCTALQQHDRHSSKSPSIQPTTSYFSIHVDSRAHVHRYSTGPPARTDSAAATQPTSLQVCLRECEYVQIQVSLSVT